MKLLIVGGVAGGASAAARARRLAENTSIVLFERGPDVSFANCGLPYYVGGEIAERNKLLVVTPELLRSRFQLDVRVRSSVEAIDRAAKKVRVRDLVSGREYEEAYDKLILAPGAAPLRPPIPGIDLPGVFTLRNLQDVDHIKDRVDHGVKQAVVVGAGFIGLELVENFVRRGIAVTVGDAIEVKDFVTGEPTQVPLAGPANRQGRIAADHIFGRAARYRGTQGTAIVRVFDLTAALTGAAEKVLRRASRPYRKIYVHPSNHAGYYPGAEAMTIKLLFDPVTGRVLGVQAVGGAGVDKRIDVLAMAIQAGMTVFDLEESELAYSPQYGSAKDPINMAGFVAAGLVRGDHPQVDVEAVWNDPPDQRPFLVDVRTPQEFSGGHIPGAVNIPLDELRSRLEELPKGKKIAAYCQVGQRGYLATRILLQAGFPAVNIGGGYKTYQLWARK